MIKGGVWRNTEVRTRKNKKKKDITLTKIPDK